VVTRRSRIVQSEPPLTMDEAAHALGGSLRWFQGAYPLMPQCHLRIGRKKMFDDVAIATLKEHLRCPAESSSRTRRVRRTTISGARNSESDLMRVKRLATSGSRSRPPK
jgi:hypothetical protein